MSSANSAALWKQNKETRTTQSRQCVTSTTTAEDFTGSDGAAGVGSAGGGDADCAGSDTEQATTRSAPRSAPRGAEVAVEAHPTRKCSRPPQEPPPTVLARRDASAVAPQRSSRAAAALATRGCADTASVTAPAAPWRPRSKETRGSLQSCAEASVRRPVATAPRGVNVQAACIAGWRAEAVYEAAKQRTVSCCCRCASPRGTRHERGATTVSHSARFKQGARRREAR